MRRRFKDWLLKKYIQFLDRNIFFLREFEYFIDPENMCLVYFYAHKRLISRKLTKCLNTTWHFAPIVHEIAYLATYNFKIFRVGHTPTPKVGLAFWAALYAAFYASLAASEKYNLLVFYSDEFCF